MKFLIFVFNFESVFGVLLMNRRFLPLTNGFTFFLKKYWGRYWYYWKTDSRTLYLHFVRLQKMVTLKYLHRYLQTYVNKVFFFL